MFETPNDAKENYHNYASDKFLTSQKKSREMSLQGEVESEEETERLVVNNTGSRTINHTQNVSSSRGSLQSQVLLAIVIGTVFLYFTDVTGLHAVGNSVEIVVKNVTKPSTQSIESQVPSTDNLEESTHELPTDSSTDTTSRRIYRTRGRPRNETDRQNLMNEWGSWTLVDEMFEQRPKNDYYQRYPNRDIPRADFPLMAWQVDSNYLSQFLPESIQLIDRAQKAILAEYGQNNSDMFHIYKYENVDNITMSGGSQGGWTTHHSWEGLKRRLLHAILTEDVFVFAMGGHSAAAGHGNHFQQSYTLQVQWILEPIFARLGVQMIARNFGNGGLGTVHNGLAAGDIYGHDLDMLMWDSGMTESNNREKEVFHRQGLMGGNKVPILWTKADKIAKELFSAANIEIGVPGDGTSAVNTIKTFDDLMASPYPLRYLKCGGDVKSICKKYEYNGVCWIDRPDYEPTHKQDSHPGGQAGWHPGNLHHQLTGRVITYTILEALSEALQMWHESPGFALPDSAWHVTPLYESVRKRLAEAPLEPYHCINFQEFGLEFTCQTPMKARTEFTPRAFPSLTNIRTLMPPSMRAEINDGEPNAYEPPDVFNPSLHPPEGEVDVLSIVEAGVPFVPILAPTWNTKFYKQPTFSHPPMVPPGKGINLATVSGDEYCDGSLDSWCSRGESEPCLLRAHNDGRNGLVFDSLSGWIVMNIPDLKHGYIVVKFETWHQSGSAYKTEGWTSINNETLNEDERVLAQKRNTESTSTPTTHSIDSREKDTNRLLKKKPPALCANLHFEYAIDGKITSLNLDQFKEQKQDIARVVETLVLLRDPSYTGGVEKEVEVALRITGCQRTNTFKLSHIYWA